MSFTVAKIKILQADYETRREGFQDGDIVVAQIDNHNKAAFAYAPRNVVPYQNECVFYPGNYSILDEVLQNSFVI